VPDGNAPDGVEGVEAEDVLLAGAPARPISHVQGMPTVWITHNRASLQAPRGPAHEGTLQPIDQLLEAEAVVAVHMLSSQGDDSAAASAHSSSSSRQSA
jgi:hypothetical protein